jgi:hypothetical protein
MERFLPESYALRVFIVSLIFGSVIAFFFGK